MKKGCLWIGMLATLLLVPAVQAQARQVQVLVDRLEYTATYVYVHVYENELRKVAYRITHGPDEAYILATLERMIGKTVFIYTEEDEGDPQTVGTGGKRNKTFPTPPVNKLGEPLKYVGTVTGVSTFGASQWIEPYPRHRKVTMRRNGSCLELYSVESSERLLLFCEVYPVEAWVDEQAQELLVLETNGEVHVWDFQGQYLRQEHDHPESEEVLDIH